MCRLVDVGFGQQVTKAEAHGRVQQLAGDAHGLQDGRGQLIVAHMTQPPAGRIYEVWLQRPGQAPQPTTALFGVTHSGSADVVVPGTLKGVQRVLVTDEPLGGSLKPTRTPVIVVPA